MPQHAEANAMTLGQEPKLILLQAAGDVPDARWYRTFVPWMLTQLPLWIS